MDKFHRENRDWYTTCDMNCKYVKNQRHDKRGKLTTFGRRLARHRLKQKWQKTRSKDNEEIYFN